jgi:hypothetical protein
MKEETFPLMNLILLPMYSRITSSDSQKDIFLNAQKWSNYVGSNLLNSNGVLTPSDRVDPRLYYLKGSFSLENKSSKKIFTLNPYSGSRELDVEFEDGHVLIKEIKEMDKKFPLLSSYGLFDILYDKPFFSKTGSKKELEARIKFFEEKTHEVFGEIPSQLIISNDGCSNPLYLENPLYLVDVLSLKGYQTEQDLSKKLYVLTNFYNSNLAKFSLGLFEKYDRRIVAHLNYPDF